MATKAEPVPQEVQDYFDRKFLGKTQTFADQLDDAYLPFSSDELEDIAALPDSCKGPSLYHWPIGNLRKQNKLKENMFQRLKNLFRREPKQSVESRLEMLEVQLRDYINRYALCDARIKDLQYWVELHKNIINSESRNCYKVICNYFLSEYLKDGWEYLDDVYGESLVGYSLIRKPLITKKSTEKPVKKKKKR